MANQLQIRRDTSTNWTTYNPILHDGEPGLETDTLKIKYGNGTTSWNSLAYLLSGNTPEYEWVGTSIRFKNPNGTWGAYVELDIDTQVLNNTKKVSDEGLSAYWSMDSVPEIPDDPAGVTYLQDAWADVDEWITSGGTGAITVSGGIATITNPTGSTYMAHGLSASDKTVKVKIRQPTGVLGTLRVDCVGATQIYPSDRLLSRDWKMFSISFTGTVSAINILLVEYQTNFGILEIDWIYIGTGAYLPNSLIDNSGNGNHGTIYGATPVAGISGKALAFDGVNDYIEVPNFTMPSITTIRFVLPNGSPTTAINKTFFSRGLVTGALLWLYRRASNTNLVVVYWTGTIIEEIIVVGFFDGYTAIPVDCVIEINWPTGALEIYRNGNLFTTSAMTTPSLPATGTLYIGKYQGNTNYFDSTIDEPRIYNRALSAEEVYSLYHNKGGTKSIVGETETFINRSTTPVIAQIGAGIIESGGDDTNGRYIKYGDGTMVQCFDYPRQQRGTWAADSGYYFTTWFWDYPTPFVAGGMIAAFISGVVYQGGIKFFTTTTDGIVGGSNQRQYCEVWGSLNTNPFISCSVKAIGRWKA